jgi:RNA-binding protein YlmH
MLSKEVFIKNFTEDDAKEAIKIYEKYKIAYEKDITIFTNSFCPPNMWKFFEKYYKSNDFLVEVNGVFEEAERRMISFNNTYNIDYPINVLEIKNKSNFSNLKHKDYLGSILSLGIERNKIGDIVVKEDRAYLPIIEEISDYVKSNLTNIGKSPVEINILNNLIDIPTVNFEEIVINVSSLRVDGVVAKIANVSRSKSIEIIDSGKVLIDYVRAKDKSQELLEGTRLTIRGNGKYIIGEIIGETRSGKHRIVIKKYI